jgi:hypothetical protein
MCPVAIVGCTICAHSVGVYGSLRGIKKRRAKIATQGSSLTRGLTVSPLSLHLIAACLGASIQEISHWYELRDQLTLPKYKKLLRSPAYWIITIVMILGSTGGALLWLTGSEKSDLKTYMALGAAFPLFVKRAIEVVGRQSATSLGTEINESAERESFSRTFAAYFHV